MNGDIFFLQTSCDRCGGSLEKGRTMSRFNEECICMACSQKEREHPRYDEAVKAEREAMRHGNYNFKGIGF